MDNQFLRQIRQETGLPSGMAKAFCDRISELSARDYVLCLMDCNAGLSPDQEAAQERIQSEIRELVKGVKGITAVIFESDPRGTTIYLRLESGTSNSFSGNYGVPVSKARIAELKNTSFWKEHLGTDGDAYVEDNDDEDDVNSPSPG